MTPVDITNSITLYEDNVSLISGKYTYVIKIGVMAYMSLLFDAKTKLNKGVYRIGNIPNVTRGISLNADLTDIDTDPFVSVYAYVQNVTRDLILRVESTIEVGRELTIFGVYIMA